MSVKDKRTDFTARYAQIVIALVLGSTALACWFYLRSEDGTGKAGTCMRRPQRMEGWAMTMMTHACCVQRIASNTVTGRQAPLLNTKPSHANSAGRGQRGKYPRPQASGGPAGPRAAVRGAGGLRPRAAQPLLEDHREEDSDDRNGGEKGAGSAVSARPGLALPPSKPHRAAQTIPVRPLTPLACISALPLTRLRACWQILSLFIHVPHLPASTSTSAASTRAPGRWPGSWRHTPMWSW